MISFVIRQPILLYALQVVICSTIFWLFYKGVIEQGRHFVLCRSFLLFSLLASAVIPLLSIPIHLNLPFLAKTPTVYATAPFITDVYAQSAPLTKVNLLSIISVVYITITVALTFRLGLRLFSLAQIYRSGNKREEEGCLIIHSPKIESPFSFIRTIYLPKTLESAEEKIFLLHERVHIKERHSFDILLHEALSMLFWFNPVFWLTGRELKKIHEYQADRIAVTLIPNARMYQTLIAKEFLGSSPKIGHAFHGSLTKKRIIMLTQPFKTNRTVLRMALIIPVIALNFFLFSCSIKQQEATETDMPMTKTSTQTEAIAFEVVEIKPSFQGGNENDFSKWVNEQVTYPQLAKDKGIQGRVMLSFVIDTDGTLNNVSVLRGVDPILDREAVRAVSSSPKWTPGVQDGQTVKVRYNFPIHFQLRGSNNTTKSTSAAPPLQASEEVKGELKLEMVEQKPAFQGGDESTFSTWVNEQIKYPQDAKDKGIQGRVILTFIVDTDGSVRDVTVLRGIDPLLDNEAVRAVSSSPKWTPGKHKGEPVQVRYNYPVHFQLR